MVEAAHTIASEYSNDRNILGVLIREPVPDDPDFPQTCDIELALVVADLVVSSERGYVLTRRAVEDVLVDVCAVEKRWMLAPDTNPLVWILSLGDPRAFEVMRDYSAGELTQLFPNFKRFYLRSAPTRVSYWLAEAKKRLDAALNVNNESILRTPEAAYSLVYLTCALLDSSGRSFAGSYLKLPRNLRLLNDGLADELGEYLPAADKDPLEAANKIPLLASQLGSEYPPREVLTPQHAAEVNYNLSPLEVEYRSFVVREIASKDKLTALWYARAWSTYLLLHYGNVMKALKGSFTLPSGPMSTWREILGNPSLASIELFVGWIDEIYGFCVEGCKELGIPYGRTNANSNWSRPKA